VQKEKNSYLLLTQFLAFHLFKLTHIVFIIAAFLSKEQQIVSNYLSGLIGGFPKFKI